MVTLTFETREALLTLEQIGNDDSPLVISIELSLSTTPAVYVSDGLLLQKARWTMLVRETAPGTDGHRPEAGSLTYNNNDGKAECVVLVNESPARFRDLLDMFKGGHASEIAIVTEGMEHQDDYSSHWDTDLNPKIDVLRVSFGFPLPQSEA